MNFYKNHQVTIIRVRGCQSNGDESQISSVFFMIVIKVQNPKCTRTWSNNPSSYLWTGTLAHSF